MSDEPVEKFLTEDQVKTEQEQNIYAAARSTYHVAWTMVEIMHPLDIFSGIISGLGAFADELHQTNPSVHLEMSTREALADLMERQAKVLRSQMPMLMTGKSH